MTRKIATLAVSAIAVAAALTACETEDEESPPTRAESSGEVFGDNDSQNRESIEEEAEEREAEAEEGEPASLSGEEVPFVPGILHEGGEYTSVEITLENTSDQDIEVNPLSFSAVSDEGARTVSVTGEAERQVDLTTLYPGENVTGVVTFEGSFDPAGVTFDNYDIVVHGDVS